LSAVGEPGNWPPPGPSSAEDAGPTVYPPDRMFALTGVEGSMDVIANFLFLAVLTLLVLGLWSRPLLAGRWRTPGWFMVTAGLCLHATAVTRLIGGLAADS
jgi:hypothetical protein